MRQLVISYIQLTDSFLHQTEMSQYWFLFKGMDQNTFNGLKTLTK